MYILYDLLHSHGFQAVENAIDNILDIIRWVVPIGLLVMTGVDIARKVIDPDEKEGQKRIMHRIIAALVVFFVPVLKDLILRLIDIGKTGA